MEIISIATGSWFPRTKLHVKELQRFLDHGTSHLDMDNEELMKLRSTLGPEDVTYNGDRFDFLNAKLKGFDVTYYEDGLLIIQGEPSDNVHKVANDLRAFYEGPLSHALKYVFSIGSPMIAMHIPHFGKRPTLIHVKNASDSDIDELGKSVKDKVHYIARGSDMTVYFLDDFIVMSYDGDDMELVKRTRETIIMFREYEHKLQHFLDMHRAIWDSIAEVRSRPSLRVKDLPHIMDQLVDFKRDLAIGKTRLGQMLSYLPSRQAQIDEAGYKDILRELEAYRFEKVTGASNYMNELWLMLENYINSTVEMTGLLYQENLQKEVKFEQFIFLFAAVGAMLELGAVSRHHLSLTSGTGQTLTGSMSAFNMTTLLMFSAVALVISVIIFTVIKPLAGSFRHVKARSLFKGVAATKESEKK